MYVTVSEVRTDRPKSSIYRKATLLTNLRFKVNKIKVLPPYECVWEILIFKCQISGDNYWAIPGYPFSRLGKYIVKNKVNLTTEAQLCRHHIKNIRFVTAKRFVVSNTLDPELLIKEKEKNISVDNWIPLSSVITNYCNK